PPAGESRDGAVEDVDDHDRERRREADPDRDAAAERGADKEVTAELVGAERVRQARAQEGLREIDCVRVLVAEDRYEDHEHEHGEEGERGDYGGAVPRGTGERGEAGGGALQGGRALARARVSR